MQQKAQLAEHKKTVGQALAAGETIPPEVLAEYPDLQAAVKRVGGKAAQDNAHNAALIAKFSGQPVETKILGTVPKPLPAPYNRMLRGKPDRSMKAARALVGGIYESYGGGLDQIISVGGLPGSPTYKVRDLNTGEVRSHGTFIDPRVVTRVPTENQPIKPAVTAPAETPSTEPSGLPAAPPAGGFSGDLFRGTESGTAGRELRQSPVGELGRGSYATPHRWLAATYGGGPQANVKSGTREVHRISLKRPLEPEEVGYLDGGADGQSDAVLRNGAGKKGVVAQAGSPAKRRTGRSSIR